MLITGSEGYIGSNVVNHLKEKNYDVYSLDNKDQIRSEYYRTDITDKSAVDCIIERVKPDIIIHTAGLSSLVQCEKDKPSASSININGTRNIIGAIKASKRQIKMIFISSEYVFDGQGGGYKENSRRCPTTFYGQTKKMSEDDIVNELKDYIICRVANVYGRGGKFFSFLVEKIKLNNRVEVYNDVFYTPTYIDYLIDSLVRLMEKDFIGIVHLAGNERLSRYQYAVKLARVMGREEHLIKATHQPEGGLIAKDSSLNSQYGRSILKNIYPTIEKSLRYCFGDLISPYLYVEDDRGRILGIIQGKQWKEINYIESKKGAQRGGHYHKVTTEGFFIIEGKIEVSLQRIGDNQKKDYIVESNDYFIIEPEILHTFKIMEDSKWINMLSQAMVDGAKDIQKK